MTIRYARLAALLLSALTTALTTALTLSAQFPAGCDAGAKKTCIGNALYSQVTDGRGAQYVDVEAQPIKDRQQALTFEMWMKAERQQGSRVYLGGLWGPADDNNDVFVLYIDVNNDLVFEVSGDGTKLGTADNTIVRVPNGVSYGQWQHVAALFDGASQTASIYIDGVLAGGPVRNNTYPAQYLRPLERKDLPMQVGSCNALSNDIGKNRTFKGYMDEVIVWERALSPSEIQCWKNRSLNGNENGIRMYWRCNEDVNNNVSPLCDATGNNFRGLLRSGITNQRSDRAPSRPVKIAPAVIVDSLQCVNTATWTLMLTDTGVCGSSYTIRMRGIDANRFTVTPTGTVTAAPNQPVTITVVYNGTNTGAFQDTLDINPADRCGPTIRVPFKLVRNTELSYNRNNIPYDTLYVGCKETNSMDSTIRICNNTRRLGSPRTVTISKLYNVFPKRFSVIGVSLPIVLAPDSCITVTIRSHVQDTSGDYLDTLRVESDDRCNPILYVALKSRTQEVISIRNSSGTKRIDLMNFEPTCPGGISGPQYYVWKNLSTAPVTIDSIGVPPDFTHYRITLPNVLQPNTGYQPIAIRFRPRSPGNVTDSVVIRAKIQGCTIEKVIKVTGRGRDNRVQWSIQSLDFGVVTVGQQRNLNVTAYNRSVDTLRVSLYVERGEAFALLAGTSRTILPNDSVVIPLTFRPTDSLNYVDKLCLYELNCFVVDCIELKGKGNLDIFRFSPLVMELENVVACRDAFDSVYIVNITPNPQTITNVMFIDQSGGRLTAVEPPMPWSTFTIPARDSLKFKFNYRPNDLTRDRADRGFIRYKSPSTIDWQVQLIATSATPKIFVTQLSAFGTLEVGDKKQMIVVMENTSTLPVLLDTILIDPGFTIISQSKPTPILLNPRDSLSLIVEFAPTASQSYSGNVTAVSNSPCKITSMGSLTGRGVIIELENALSLINFGYIRPCECTERMLPLLNASLVYPMTVDSIWIDSAATPGGTPLFYTWTSKFSPTATLPYAIPPNSRDTVILKFCPRTPAEDRYIDCRAMMHVKAQGSGWAKETQTFLAGKRSISYKPTPVVTGFPPTAVDTLSPAQVVKIKIPDVFTNPAQDQIVIDSVTFEPNERVFEVISPPTRPFPIVINPGDSAMITVKIRPRAPRLYKARMVLHVSSPCADKDTTVLVTGSGYARTFGLNFAFDPKRVAPDTLAFISCDTLIVPVYATRTIQASVVDIMFRFGYDTTQLRLLDISSTVLSRTCTSYSGDITYTPALSDSASPYGGTDVLCKNFCRVDSLEPFVVARFVTVANNRVNSKITVDSINFDTEDVLLYRNIAGSDEATVLALKSELEFRSNVQFDSVRILECVDRTVNIYNIGDVKHTVDDLLDLSRFVTIVSTVPPLGDTVAPGDSVVATLRFCPRADSSFDSSFYAVSMSPCETRDTTKIAGVGYAPDFAVNFAAMRTFWVPDSLGGTIGDTIAVPIMVERDFQAVYGGTTYWLNGLNFDVDLQYVPRSLKYLSLVNPVEPGMTVTQVNDTLKIQVRGADTVQKGRLVDVRFLVTVPEFSRTDLNVTASSFSTDSLMFLTVLPQGLTTPFITAGKCDLTVVQFSTVGTPRMSVLPNPMNDAGTLVFRMQETVPVTAAIYDGNGMLVRLLLDGSTTLRGGEYVVRFETSELPSGSYHVRLIAGVYAETKSLIIVK